MKQIILLLLFTIQFLLAGNTLDDFINEQMKTESQLLDFNLSIEDKLDIKKEQAHRYQEFLLQYTEDRKEHLQEGDPYRYKISRLQLRLDSHKYKGNAKALMYDEILLQSYHLRRGIREAFHDVLEYTDSESKASFKDKINETLIRYFSKYTPLDPKKYMSQDQNRSTPMDPSLQTAILNLTYLENVATTFTSEVVADSAYIYRSARISRSKLYTFLKAINASTYGAKINTYLAPFHIDLAQILFAIAMIPLIFISQFVLLFIMNQILKYFHYNEEEIEYIHSHITKILKLLILLFIIHFILVVYLDYNITTINISKLFYIVYTLLIAILFYKIINTLAYIKMESIKSSKVLRDEVFNLTIKTLNGFITLVAFLAILRIMGVNLTALLSGLGIAGAAVAFAAKDSIANVFGSVSILMSEIFEQGDLIEVNDFKGTVVEIGLRGTTIRTQDNALISIPNVELASTGVKNWSRRNIGRLIHLNIGVTYESNFDDIRQAVDDIRAMLKAHPGIANEGTSYKYARHQAKLVSIDDFSGVKRLSFVHLDEFADSSINILVYCFSHSVEWSEWLEVKEDVMYKIAEILEKNHLEFAYPTLTLHHARENNKPEIEPITK